ncbi:MAG: beta-galactosidase [Eubacteriales bacterium]|nr:beta-galactosidase [Eubacteriales bacterium]
MAEIYGYTKDFLTIDGEPWFPVMGEFHFSRYPKQYWKESLYKMKAGGVEIVSTYVFWLHHEEVEGIYDFSGQRNLRKFTETVKACGLKMFLRIGPWCHGEARNGGFPDWLLKKGFEPRTNDEAYLDEVRRFYTVIASQVKGLLHEDGGPIIGIQIENEYGHCGGLNGEEGERHMRRLTELAKEAGLLAPLYTATGWGGAVTGGLLPVMGGYCEAPWDPRTTELEPNENYVFTKERNDPNIGSDYGKKNNLTYDFTAFPYLTAELGGGLQVTHHRRPVARAKDIGAMSLTKLGSGVNLLGYYMYHGGTNPEGKLTTLQESRATGYPNDLPVFSYDFSAPIREYGQMSETLKEIKLLAMFTRDFGSELCKMETVPDETEAQRPEDFERLRIAVRRNGKQGYLFVNNYQRRHVMKEHLQEKLEVKLDGETISYPPVDIRNGDFFFVPFHMPIGDGVLKSALAAPLCRLNGGEKEIFVFYTDTDPHYEWEKEPTNAEILTISREQALNAWKIGKEREYLVITEEKVLESDSGFEMLARTGGDVRSFPALPETPEGYGFAGMEGAFALYKRTEPLPEGAARCRLVREEPERKCYEIELDYPGNVEDCFLRVDFSGDQAKLRIGGSPAGDWFYTGECWEIGMKRFGFPEKIEIEIEALREKDEIFLETRPAFQNGIACEIHSVTSEAEKAVNLFL